jgi:hypothetical protein
LILKLLNKSLKIFIGWGVRIFLVTSRGTETKRDWEPLILLKRYIKFIMNRGRKRVLKEGAVSYLKLLSQHSPG